MRRTVSGNKNSDGNCQLDTIMEMSLGEEKHPAEESLFHQIKFLSIKDPWLSLKITAEE
jgi:hypothetical protein